MEEASNVFISIQSFKDFVLEHGKLYREVWKRRHSDGKPYRMVLFEDSCEAIAIHQLDRYSFEELTNLSSLRVGHFIGGGYAVF